MNSEKPRGKRIFISYAHDDAYHAHDLRSRLKKAGFDPWLAKEDIPGGARWEVEIDKAIHDSDFFLALLSPRSVTKKGYVQKELRRALEMLDQFPENQIYLIPARLDECEPTHRKLHDLQWVDLFPNLDEGFERLLRSLEAAISPSAFGAESAVAPAAPPSEVPPAAPRHRSGRVVKAMAGLGFTMLLAGLGGHGPDPHPVTISDQRTDRGLVKPEKKSSLPIKIRGHDLDGESLVEHLQGLGFPAEVPLDLDGTVLDLVLIRKGSFLMGTLPTESGRQSDEVQHRVEISRSFYIGKYEVTQELFAKVMTGFVHLNQFDGGQNPVEKVSWNDAQEFCRRLSTQLKSSIRLPTEAEWEYACRAGTSTPFHEGRRVEQLAKAAWYKDNSNFETHRVGGKAPNGWGLYDMHGNVKEWCQDWYSETLDTGPVVVDPQGPQTGIYRVSRGGGIRSDPKFCRSGYRGFELPDRKEHDRGFRIVISLRDPAETP